VLFPLILLANICLGVPQIASASTNSPWPRTTRLVPSPEGPITPLRAPQRVQGGALGPIGTLGSAALPNIQSETSIAVSGNQVVLGYNDFRGGADSSFSGVMYSSDGGVTFADGGRLPVGTGQAVSGDPVVTVYTPSVGAPIFYYISIFTNNLGQSSLSVHKSVNGGQTWTTPFEVTPATSSTAFADKPWAAVDAETGRLFVGWTSFPSTGSSQLKVTYSDNQAVSWSAAKTIGTGGQGISLATDPHSTKVYAAWLTGSSGASQIGFARSTDNGANWTASVKLTPAFAEVVPPYGFDRYNSFPSLAVNPSDGGVELVYPASVNGTPTADFGDVYYRRSADGGVTFSTPLALNSAPGSDRPQEFPTVSATNNGRIDVFWYDESIGSDVSDLTDYFYTFSTDFGATWSSPVPVNPTPVHNESGNNFSAPHQGDYIDATYNVSNNTAYGGMTGFADPHPFGTGADGLVATVASPAQFAALRVRPGTVQVFDSGCNANDGVLVAGESAAFTIPLENFGRTTLTGISAILSSLTPGVTVTTSFATYPTLLPHTSASQASGPYSITLSPSYQCGMDARFRLTISASGAATTYVEFALRTGVVTTTTTLLSENFDSVIAPALPAGWTLNNGCSTCATNDWKTTTTMPLSPPNAAFANDAAYSSFGRLFGPAVAVPANATYTEVQFDVMYGLEAQDTRTGFDALSFEYQIDGTGSSHFATADAIEFDYRYTHYIVRASGGGNGFGDRSAWSSSSGGYKHVRIRIPGLAGHTLTPRFSVTTDANTGGSGAWVDNVLITALQVGCGACVTSVAERSPAREDVEFSLAGANPVQGGATLRYRLQEAGAVRIDVYSLSGRRVRTLVDRNEGAGDHTVAFSLRGGSASETLVPGMYVVRLVASGTTREVRVVALQ
jgi:hypothetical protein